VGHFDGSRCTHCFEVVYTGCGPINPCVAHVALSDSSESASFGLMICNVHMASKVVVCRHVA
jgi:hypothetical protein